MLRLGSQSLLEDVRSAGDSDVTSVCTWDPAPFAARVSALGVAGAVLEGDVLQVAGLLSDCLPIKVKDARAESPK